MTEWVIDDKSGDLTEEARRCDRRIGSHIIGRLVRVCQRETKSWLGWGLTSHWTPIANSKNGSSKDLMHANRLHTLLYLPFLYGIQRVGNVESGAFASCHCQLADLSLCYLIKACTLQARTVLSTGGCTRICTSLQHTLNTAPQIRSHDFWCYINLYGCMYNWSF